MSTDYWNKVLHFNLVLQCYNQFNHLYYPKQNRDRSLRGADYIIVTGIYDSRWRAFSRSRLSANDRTNRF